jgi:hypothetical protein
MKIDYQQLDYYHPKLKEVLHWMELHFGVEFTITSQWREGDGGVHGTIPLRATDLRCHSTVLGGTFEEVVNANWEYDYRRPEMRVCIYHDVGRGKHLHIQVHDNTVRVD